MAAPTLVFVPQNKQNVSESSIALDQIPQDIKDQVEQVYELLKNNLGRFNVVFETKQEKLQYIAMVKSYCAQRPTGEIYFRKSPTRNQPENEMDFRISDKKVENDKVAADINDAAAKVTKARKTAAPTATA